MLAGERYLADDPELLEDRRRCRLLTEQEEHLALEQARSLGMV